MLLPSSSKWRQVYDWDTIKLLARQCHVHGTKILPKRYLAYMLCSSNLNYHMDIILFLELEDSVIIFMYI